MESSHSNAEIAGGTRVQYNGRDLRRSRENLISRKKMRLNYKLNTLLSKTFHKIDYRTRKNASLSGNLRKRCLIVNSLLGLLSGRVSCTLRLIPGSILCLYRAADGFRKVWIGILADEQSVYRVFQEFILDQRGVFVVVVDSSYVLHN